jgi:hypothetical protein
VGWKTKLFLCLKMEDIRLFENRNWSKTFVSENGESKRVFSLQEILDFNLSIYIYIYICVCVCVFVCV